jgi:hypothetical protein
VLKVSSLAMVMLLIGGLFGDVKIGVKGLLVPGL